MNEYYEETHRLGNIEITYPYKNEAEQIEQLQLLIDELFYAMKWLIFEYLENDKISDKDIAEELEDRLPSDFDVVCNEEEDEQDEE